MGISEQKFAQKTQLACKSLHGFIVAVESFVVVVVVEIPVHILQVKGHGWGFKFINKLQLFDHKEHLVGFESVHGLFVLVIVWVVILERYWVARVIVVVIEGGGSVGWAWWFENYI